MWVRLGTLVNRVVSWLIFSTVSVLNFVVGIGVQSVLMPFDPDRRAILWVNHLLWGNAVFRLQPLWTLRRTGFDRVGPGPYVVVSNHLSMLDIPAMMLLPLPVRLVGRHQLFRVPLLGWYMRFSRQIPLDPTSPQSIQEFMTRCHTSLKAGISVAIFPEGTRAENGRMRRFRGGAFRLAMEAGVPVLPVVLEGTQYLMPRGSAFPIRPHVTVRLQVLAPIDPRAFADADALSAQVRVAMERALEGGERPTNETSPLAPPL